MLSLWNEPAIGRFPWGGFEDDYRVLGELRREMDRLFDQPVAARGGALDASRPRVRIEDEGDHFLLSADVPGFTQDMIELTLDRQTLSLRGERAIDGEEDHEPLRRERGALRFAHSFALPTQVDADAAEARLADGMLTLRLPKAPEAKPRKIEVQS